MVDLRAAPVVAVLTRAPGSGGKTRLFASLGIPHDPALAAALLLDTLEGISSPGIRRIVAVTPASACDDVRRLIAEAAGESPESNPFSDIAVMAQPDGDLGARMHGTMAALFARGAAVVALIGSDVPHVMPSAIAEACGLAARAADSLVLGPAADGGYYLIAAQRVPQVFTGIEWGSDRVLADTERAAARAGLTVRRIETMRDVDNAADLAAAVRDGHAVRTTRWLRARNGDSAPN